MMPSVPCLPAPERRALPLDVTLRPGYQSEWPFAELTQEQRLDRAKQEARMRANALRGLPSCFGALS